MLQSLKVRTEYTLQVWLKFVSFLVADWRLVDTVFHAISGQSLVEDQRDVGCTHDVTAVGVELDAVEDGLQEKLVNWVGVSLVRQGRKLNFDRLTTFVGLGFVVWLLVSFLFRFSVRFDQFDATFGLVFR